LIPIRILIADDYENWRRQVRILLQARPEWQIICDVSDGDEAVRKAEELQPDLILLDVGLPKLNGIDAARRIRQLSPASKILFMSTDNSEDVVELAMSTDAYGYVYKARAQSELLPAIDAVLRGEHFVTGRLTGHKVAGSTEAKAPHFHEVLFYSDDEVFVENFAHFIAATLGAGDVAVVVANEAHRNRIAQRLNGRGSIIDAAIREGRFISLDADETLSTFMVNNMPDSNRFFEVVAGLIKTAAKAVNKERPRVTICGEGVSILCAQGNLAAAIRFKQLCNELATRYEVDILCGYSLSGFHGEMPENVFETICAEHSAVYPR
jgi:DNA-binding NarL/FixJ family response regulator